MAELLLEILSEEIPARMQARVTDDLKRLMCDGIKGAGLEFSSAETYVRPRRLVFVADGIPERTPDISEERKGPATSVRAHSFSAATKCRVRTSVSATSKL